MSVQTLTRTFKIGCALIEDPAPGLSLDVVQQLLAATYPQVRWTKLYESDGVLVGKTLQFNVIIPPVKTNG
jgi:PRTRC genetic system protein C